MKKIRKILVGGREEGIRPKLPDHLLPRKIGKASEYPPDRIGTLGPHRELKKEEQLYLKDQVGYKHATPQQLAKGEQCSTCIHWKDGAACHIVLGFIHENDWCNKWEKAEVLQKALPSKAVEALHELTSTKTSSKTKKHPKTHSHRDDHPTHLHVEVHKEGDGGGDGAFGDTGGTVFTSTNSGIFSPTHGEREIKPKKKKSGIERLGQFMSGNSPEKKMVKSDLGILTDLVNDVILDMRKEDQKRQTPYNSKPIEDDPPQVVERESDGATEDGNLVTDQDNTEKEQKRIMEEDKNKDGSDSSAILNAWNSGGTDVDELHRGGKKDELESDEESNEPEEIIGIPEDLKEKAFRKRVGDNKDSILKRAEELREEGEKSIVISVLKAAKEWE